MKNKNIPSGVRNAAIHVYQSGAEVGREPIDFSQYRLWAEVPSEVCEAHRVLTAEQIARFGLQPDTTIFAIEG
jgi:hypothetical protein